MDYDFQIITNGEFLDGANKAIREGIINFNEPYIGSKPEKFSVSVKDQSDSIIGGAIVYTHPSSIYVDVLWIDEKYRGKGLGKDLLLAVEAEAAKRGIGQSTLDTFSFQAEQFYLKLGYEKIGVINDYIEGHDRIYLCIGNCNGESYNSLPRAA